MTLAFFQQENLIFFPQKLPKTYAFTFNREFEEIYIPAPDGITLHGLLFKAAAPKGLVFFLHGNAGALDSWGELASTYTDLNHDLFILDYRGFGKSEGSISSEKQFYADAQAAYDLMKKRYAEDRIILVGFSIGTATAAKLAAENQPRQLILQAPYYSLSDLMQQLYPFVPAFLLKYKFETFRFLQHTKAPVTIFHGDRDEVIYPASSEKLKAHLKPTDRVIMLNGQGHNGMQSHPVYQQELARLLAGDAPL